MPDVLGEIVTDVEAEVRESAKAMARWTTDLRVACLATDKGFRKMNVPLTSDLWSGQDVYLSFSLPNALRC